MSKSKMSTSVYTFEWDLSSGLLSPVVRHVGILVFGTFYEFCKEGILITKVLPGCLPPTPQGGTPLKEFGVLLGRTAVTEAEFNKWISRLSLNEFKAGSYNVVFKNCMMFAELICRGLGIKPPLRWDVAMFAIGFVFPFAYAADAISDLGSSNSSKKK